MKSTSLHSGDRCFHLLQRSCTEQQNLLLINFWQSSHRIGTTAFSRQKLNLTDVVRRGLISHLLPCYLSWQSSGHIRAYNTAASWRFWESQLSSGLYAWVWDLVQKTTGILKLGNWAKRPKTQFCQRTKLHLMLICPNSLEIELIHNNWSDTS